MEFAPEKGHPETFGEILRTARHGAGLTQQALAEVLGIHRENISYYENGHSLPEPAKCEAVGMRLEEALNATAVVVLPGRLAAAARQDWDARRAKASDETLVALMADRSRLVRRAGGGLAEPDGRQLAERFRRLFRAIERAERDGSAGAIQQALVAAEELDRLENAYPPAAGLRRHRARVLEGAGEWQRAIADLQWVLETFERPPTADAVRAGAMLLTLGEFRLAEAVLGEVVVTLGRVPTATRLGPPHDPNERNADRLEAMSFLLWIDDYRGGFRAIEGRTRALLDQLRLPQNQRSGLLHRLGRSRLTAALSAGRGAEAAQAGDMLQEAKRLAGPSANMYHDLWIARAAEASGNRYRAILRGRAVEAVMATGGSAIAHVYYDEGLSLLTQGRSGSAEEKLRAALEIWARHHYVKGGFDILLELGNLYEGLGDAARGRAAFEACMLLGERMGLQRLPDAVDGVARTTRTDGPINNAASHLPACEPLDGELRKAISDLLARIPFRW